MRRCEACAGSIYLEREILDESTNIAVEFLLKCLSCGRVKGDLAVEQAARAYEALFPVGECGHLLDTENTGVNKKGGPVCKTCARLNHQANAKRRAAEKVAA